MSDEPAIGPGKRLKSAREAMEVSAREVADALNLPLRVISALESDDYERLPPSVFTRGYLRSYARLLELPQEELLELYPEVETDAEPVAEATAASPLANQRNRLLAAGAAVVAVLLVIVLWLVGSSSTTDDGADSSSTREASPGEVAGLGTDAQAGGPSTAEPGSGQEREDDTLAGTTEESFAAGDSARASDGGAEPRGDGAPSMITAPAPARETASAEPIEEELAGGPRGSAAAAPEATVAELETGGAVAPVGETEPAAPGVRRITEFGDETLSFYFERDCWVEVKSSDGDNLYSDLNRAGRRLELVGRGPFRIRLGYAPGATLVFNGETIDLSRYTRNNVANLVLGE